MIASISVVTYNRKAMSQVCIESILDNTPEGEYELIVVDNCSTDGTQDALKAYGSNIHKKLLKTKNYHLGYAINQAYKNASSKAEWLITFANDEYAMPGWFENFKTVAQDLNPDYIYCMMRIASFKHKEILTTENGGKYLTKTEWPEIGATFAVRQKMQRLYDIWFNPAPWRPGYGSPFSLLKMDLDYLGWSWVELAKPCVLIQNCRFDDPEYADYYEETWGARGKLERWEALKDNENYVGEDTLKEYYEGSSYIYHKT